MSEGFPFITIPLLSWLVAQLYKFASSALKGAVDFSKLYSSGGMPSAHTALIVATTTTLGVLEGGSSPIFGLALIISVIVIYDALGVRRSTGLHAEAIKELLGLRSKKEDRPLMLGTAKGHTFAEVLAGAALGAGVAFVLTYQHSLAKLKFLFGFPTSAENTAWLITTVAVVIIATYAVKNSSKLRSMISMGTSLVLGAIWLLADTGTPWLGYRFMYILVPVLFIGYITIWKLFLFEDKKNKKLLNLTSKRLKRKKSKRKNKKKK